MHIVLISLIHFFYIKTLIYYSEREKKVVILPLQDICLHIEITTSLFFSPDRQDLFKSACA